MKKSNLVLGLVGFGISLVVVYATIFVAGRGWKKSQKNGGEFLNIDGVATSGVCRRLNEDGSYSTYSAQGDINPCPSGGFFIPRKPREKKSLSLTK